MALLLGLTLLAATDWTGFHTGVSAGVGMGHDLAGARLEVRYDHVSLFAGTGASFFAGDYGGKGYGGAFGARWYSGLGDRFFVSLQYVFVTYQSGYVDDTQQGRTVRYWVHDAAASAVAGWRWRWSGFFLEAGLGGGLAWERGDATHPDPFPVPDLTLALGWEF